MRRALIRWLAVCGRARGHCDQVRDIGPGRSSGEYPMAILIIWSFIDILTTIVFVDTTPGNRRVTERKEARDRQVRDDWP